MAAVTRTFLRPLSFSLTLFLAPPAYTEPPPPPSPPLSHLRRERAARALTIAATVQPTETAAALKIARQSLRQNTLTPHERLFLRSSLQDGAARGVACAAGGAAASFAIFKLVLLAIPLQRSRTMGRIAVTAVSFGAAVVELAAFPDVTTVELMMMGEGAGFAAKKELETWNPDLVLLRTIERQCVEASEYSADTRTPAEKSVDGEIGVEELVTGEFIDAEMHFR